MVSYMLTALTAFHCRSQAFGGLISTCIRSSHVFGENPADRRRRRQEVGWLPDRRCFPAGSELPDQFTPSPIDAPWNYDDAGEPANQEIRERWEYLQSLTEAEERRKFDHMLSSVCDGMGRR
ncbi:hypothetical protein V8C43DRAFT_179815 [Trichoderma afarasin]